MKNIEKINRSTTQRFLSKDPIGFNSGDFNFYRYVGNSPGNFVDALGLWVYVSEYGTTGNGLTNHMLDIENAVDQGYIDAGGDDCEPTVTYTTNGTHSPNSLHYSGNAIDLRVWGLTNAEKADWAQRIQDSIGNNYDVVNEGDHIHVEYDPN